MLRFGHRVSRDIGLFFDDAQALGYLSPRLNDVAAAITSDYQEQANSIKLVLPDGDIDFIVAGNVTRAEPEVFEFEGRRLWLEATAEILAKKLLYRAASFKPRDVFDLGVALPMDRPAARRALQATRRTGDTLLGRWARTDDAVLLRDILVTEAGLQHVSTLIPVVMEAIREVGDDG